MTTDGADTSSALKKLKQELRKQAKARRQRQEDRDELSRHICQRLAGLAEYASARTVMIYVGVRSEVQTRPFLRFMWSDQKRVVVPMCVGDELELYRLESLDELSPRTLGIPEPTEAVQDDSARKVDVRNVDLLVVPGVAFDHTGGRLGYGKGYFDRLLRYADPDTPIVGLAFVCQIVPKIPMGSNDIFFDKVITENAVYERPAQEHKQ